MSGKIDIEGPIRTAGGSFAVVVEQELWKSERFTTLRRSPAAVLFLEPGGPRAVDLQGREVDLDALVEKVPTLRALLEAETAPPDSSGGARHG